jgi:hypothetical protein
VSVVLRSTVAAFTYAYHPTNALRPQKAMAVCVAFAMTATGAAGLVCAATGNPGHDLLVAKSLPSRLLSWGKPQLMDA